MRISTNQVPEKINVPGAGARHPTDLGDAIGFAKMEGEYFSLGAGTDIAPPLKRIESDAHQAPPCGYRISSELVVASTSRNIDICKENDLFYWPPNQRVRVIEQSEVILFRPQRERTHAVDHMVTRMTG